MSYWLPHKASPVPLYAPVYRRHAIFRCSGRAAPIMRWAVIKSKAYASLTKPGVLYSGRPSAASTFPPALTNASCVLPVLSPIWPRHLPSTAPTLPRPYNTVAWACDLIGCTSSSTLQQNSEDRHKDSLPSYLSIISNTLTIERKA